MGLPLLRLPNLVITSIVDITEIEDLTCLSLCSKRAQNILIVCRRRNRLEKQYIRTTAVCDRTSVDVVNKTVIEVVQISNLQNYMKIGHSKDCQLFSNRTLTSVTEEIKEMETVEIGGHRVPFYRGNEALITFWEDERIGLPECLDFVMETFRIPVICFQFSQKGMWAFDWINGWEEKIQEMTFEVHGIQDHELKHVMKNCESRTLFTSGGMGWPPQGNYDYGKRAPSRSFHFDLSEMKSTWFFARTAYWITVPNIAASFLEALVIEASSLTQRDVNLFLRLWLVGGFPCLRYIFIQLCESIQFATVANGIENELRETSYRHKFYKQGLDSASVPHLQFDLQQRENGNKKASIRFHTTLNSVLMSVWK